MATVYRTLDLFTAIGLVRVLTLKTAGCITRSIGRAITTII